MSYFIYSIIALTIIGLLGIALSNRNKTPDVRKARWGKTISYICIIYGMFGFIIKGGRMLSYVGLVIAVVGLIEILKLIYDYNKTSCTLFLYQIAALGLYGFIAWGFLLFLGLPTEGVLFVAAIVFVFDAFSQISGQMVGKYKLAPHTSPNKTIEGFLGGFIFAIATGLLLSVVLHLSPQFCFFNSIVIALSSLVGDLMASHFKRRHGVKDFSQWIPYQGGFLDRFDSLLMAGAVSAMVESFSS